MTVARIEEAIEEIRQGKMVILVDDEDRENEGDLTMAAEMITPEAINFMARYGRGLICLTMTAERCDHLRLPPHGLQQHFIVRHGIHRFHRSQKGSHHRHIRCGSLPHDPYSRGRRMQG